MSNPINDFEVGRLIPAFLEDLNRQLRDPTGLVAAVAARVWRYLLWAFVLYLWAFGLMSGNTRAVIFWLATNLAFIVFLEYIRIVRNKFFDIPVFRLIKILADIAFISWVVALSSDAKIILVLVYAIPLLTTVVYFPDSVWITAAVYGITLMGLIIAGMDPAVVHKFTGLQTILFAVGLGGLSVVLHRLPETAIFSPGQLSDIAEELHNILDLGDLVRKVAEVSLKLTGASRALVLVIDPEHLNCIGSAHPGLKLRAQESFSIGDVVDQCFKSGVDRLIDADRLRAPFEDGHIYSKYFDCNPRSKMTEILYRSDGEIFGVIGVAHDFIKRFDPVTKILVHNFGFLVSRAIENSITLRDLELKEESGRIANEKLINANTEREVSKILVEAARQLIPSTERCILHRFVSKSGALIPAFMSENGKLVLWDSNPKPTGHSPTGLSLGVGVAGSALSSRKTILVRDVATHPLYKRSPLDEHIKSLLVSPLYDPKSGELFGTLSIVCTRSNAFTEDDRSKVESLVHQGSNAITRVRESARWKKQSGLMRKILDALRQISIASVEEKILFTQMANSATRVLGFRIAEIMLLDPATSELNTAALSGVRARDISRSTHQHVPFSVFAPPLLEMLTSGHPLVIPNEEPALNEVASRYFGRPRRNSNPPAMQTEGVLTSLQDQSGHIVGLLYLGMPKTDTPLRYQEYESISVFANAISWIIELKHAQGHIQEQRLRTLYFIETLSRDLAKLDDFQAIGEVVVQIGSKLLSAEGCSLYMVREDQKIELTHSTFLASTYFIGRRKPIQKKDKCGLTAWVAATGETICYNNEEYKQHAAWAGEEDHLQYMPSRKCRSLLMVPVKNSRNNVLGVLTLENKRLAGSEEYKDFDEHDIERVGYLASELAQALENISRYDNIQNWERKGIEDDLHDLVNWYHLGVATRIDSVNEWLERGDYERAKKLLPEIQRHAYTTTNQLKKIHTNILSECMKCENLADALDRMVTAWSSRTLLKNGTAISIQVDCPRQLETTAQVRNVLIRIASEATANAIKHSGALEDPKIKILLKVYKRKNLLTLMVADTGKGMDREKNPEGFGINQMRSLANQINALGGYKVGFRIQSSPGRGTKVLVPISLPPARSAFQ